MKSIFLFFSLIFLIASCDLKLPEGCSASDSFSFEESLWSVDIESSSIASMQSGWENKDIFEIIGVDESSATIYFTYSSNNYSGKILKLDFSTQQIDMFNVDPDGDSYILSPNGNFLAYEKGYDIWITTVNGDFFKPIPRNDTISSLISPQWVSSHQIAFGAFDSGGLHDSNVLGMFKVDLSDSSLTKLSDMIGSLGYDISQKDFPIVLSNGTIFFKERLEEEFKVLSEGNFPKLVSSDTGIVYETLDGIWLSDFEGNSEKIYSKSGGGSISGLNNIAVSPDGSYIAIAWNNEINLINILSKEVQKIISAKDFISEEESLRSNNITFSSPHFSSDGEKIYFVVRREFHGDGC